MAKVDVGKDIQAEINRLAANNPNDPNIPKLEQARKEKQAMMAANPNVKSSDFTYVYDPNEANGNNSGGGSGTATKSSIQSEIDRLAELRKQQTLAGLEKSKSNALSNLSAEKASIAPMYQQKKGAVATQSAMGAKSFSEYLAKRGLNKSGTGAQAEIARNVALQGNLGALNQAEAGANADIARRETDVNNAYESDVAAANANIEAQKLENTIAEMKRQEDIARQNEAIAREDARFNKQFDYQKERDTKTDTFRDKQFEESIRQFNVGQQNWQKEYSLKEIEQKINTALQQQRISLDQAQVALQQARFAADQDPNSIDNQLKKQTIEMNKQDKEARQLNNVISNIDNLYTSKDPYTGTISVTGDKTALRSYIIGLGLNDSQTDQLLLRYGLPIN